jgi:hypothetical protein
MNKNTKNGPIHFFTSYERESHIETVVEYCVQVGEGQPLNRTQASYLVGRGDVLLEGRQPDLGEIIPHGAWQLTVRGRNHHLVVHGTAKE